MTHDPSQPVLELCSAMLQEKDLSTWAKESLPEYLSSALKDGLGGLGFHFSDFSALSWLKKSWSAFGQLLSSGFTRASSDTMVFL